MKKGRRKKGSGTLYRNKGSAVWVAQWEMNGKRFRKSTGTSVHKEAVKLLAEFVAPFASRKEEETVKALSARVEGLHKQAGHLAFEEAWTVFAGRKADRTIGSERDEALYAGRWRKLAEWMKENHPEKASLDQLDEETAKEFLSAVFDTSTAKTYNEFRGLFAQVWEVLKKPAGLDSNPWKAIPKKPVKKDTIPQRKLTDEELQALIRHLETECAPELRLFFLLGIYTGQRSNDCALLEWEDVDLPANRIRCKRCKSPDSDSRTPRPRAGTDATGQADGLCASHNRGRLLDAAKHGLAVDSGDLRRGRDRNLREDLAQRPQGQGRWIPFATAFVCLHLRACRGSLVYRAGDRGTHEPANDGGVCPSRRRPTRPRSPRAPGLRQGLREGAAAEGVEGV